MLGILILFPMLPFIWLLHHLHPDQLGHVEDYDQFLNELTKVWEHAFRVLVPGGRLVCVVGDVCLSRRKYGRHVVVPLHADISVACRKLGFDNLNPIIWHKISNASYEVSNGGKFLGKPYEPNAIIKNDIEFILMQRKPGGYRRPTQEQRRLSMIGKKDFDAWFRQFWTISGASTRKHPAPFPLELASRLVRMFSFYGDTVLDPFCGTGTTLVAALRAGRNSIGLDIDAEYCRMAARWLKAESLNLFMPARLVFQKSECVQDEGVQGECAQAMSVLVRDEPGLYSVRSKRTIQHRDIEVLDGAVKNSFSVESS
jgi:DNA modification methylase